MKSVISILFFMSIISTVFSSEDSGKNPTYVIQVQQGTMLLGEIIIETFP